MLRLFRALLLGALGRCPHCGRGQLFRSFYGLQPACAVCGTRFERTGNQSTGGMAINLVVTILLGFAGGILLVLHYPDFVLQGLLIMLAGLTVFHLLFYRPAKGLWIGLMELTGDMDHDG